MIKIGEVRECYRAWDDTQQWVYALDWSEFRAQLREVQVDEDIQLTAGMERAVELGIVARMMSEKRAFSRNIHIVSYYRNGAGNLEVTYQVTDDSEGPTPAGQRPPVRAEVAFTLCPICNHACASGELDAHILGSHRGSGLAQAVEARQRDHAAVMPLEGNASLIALEQLQQLRAQRATEEREDPEEPETDKPEFIVEATFKVHEMGAMRTRKLKEGRDYSIEERGDEIWFHFRAVLRAGAAVLFAYKHGTKKQPISRFTSDGVTKDWFLKNRQMQPDKPPPADPTAVEAKMEAFLQPPRRKPRVGIL